MRPALQADALRQRCRRALTEHRRRARADGVTLPYGMAELLQLAGAAVQCAYCRQPVAWDFQVDHKQPIARGGRHALANLAIAHAECNRAKGALTAEEYLQLLALLRGFHPAAAADVLRRLRAGGRRYRPGRAGLDAPGGRRV